MSDDDTFEVEGVTVLKNTGSALLCEAEFFEDDDGKVWVPLSQIHEDSEVYDEGDEGRLVVSGWLARERGWA